MDIDRRYLLLGSVTGAAAFATPAASAPSAAQGLDAAQLGVKANAPDDQTQRLQRAIDQATRARQPLWLAPGVYRAGDLKLAAGSQLVGVRGATRLTLSKGPSLLSAEGADDISLSGLTLDGGGQPPAANRALLHLTAAKGLRIADCTITGAGGNAIGLFQCAGEVTGNAITGAGDNALHSLDSRGLTIRANTISKSGNGGIRIWQSIKRSDGSIVSGNTITDTGARAGGTGQNGNAINVFRAGNVIVSNNVIRGAAFTAVRGNGASNIQIVSNNCTGLEEVAIYAEFDFDGAVIANNSVDGAALGVVTTNFNNGGRLAVVQGNIIRNLKAARPQGGTDFAGIGIGVEADTAVTGNVIEGAPFMGIHTGTGKYQRDVNVTGNIIRMAGIGIGVSVAPGAGAALIASNLIAGAKRGAIVGMEWDKVVTGDLATGGAERYPRLRLTGNQVV